MKIAATLTPVLRGLGHMFFPPLCQHCRAQLTAQEAVLCTTCEVLLPETNFHTLPDNAAARLFYGRVAIENVTSLAYFADGGMMQVLLHGLKYDNRKTTGTWLGNRLGYRIATGSWGADIDYIVPVPLHPAKEAQRGYNQSEFIARGIGQATSCDVRTDILARQRKTDSQTRKTRVQRVENMAGAFAVTNSNTITGRHLLLCDDVLTTGATLEACALALKQAADVKISIATIAIAMI
jgi:ComF family protein